MMDVLKFFFDNLFHFMGLCVVQVLVALIIEAAVAPFGRRRP